MKDNKKSNRRQQKIKKEDIQQQFKMEDYLDFLKNNLTRVT